MNQMTDAFAKAGFPTPPLAPRVWQIVKDHGPIDYQSITTRLGEPAAKVTTALGNMTARGLLESHGRRGRPRTYTANAATYDEALKFKRKPIRVTDITPAPPRPDCSPAGGLPRELDRYTLGQLREFHRALDTLFGSGT